ncbi:hypothetical protein GUITHDRAFT_138880 [Guillardia theta CCMP2712]|uniref:Sulfotransferase domain-containing protein n=1 Tax=Guillardia theta (strain CCMP2712) TaxID=905079 RepID=L1JAX0_GUITC|nr:hypothetical protein GUITHDRAFT_138880 [Guillardia theta CCMP2712]EKX45676.1 hypothetical protein GUITHDRAFT_138880 [Guillardia theta CCMP2712]|eukprot:XP_005832656.1 hypothetical protein GUITHDRAFT_138880 [Guillardia theta CCMP2712]
MRALDFGNLTHPGPDGSKTSQPQMYFLCYMNDRWKAMLLHIPKNAGSSVAENLADIFCAATENATCDTKEQRMKHFKISEKCVKNPSYFSFAFTRNPWDRAVSFWSYGLKRRQLAVKDLKKRKELAAKYCSFRQFLFNKGRGGCGYHTEYEQYPLIYDSKGRPGLNFLGRVEHFQRDFQAILMRIDPTGKLLAVYRKLGFVMHNDSGHRPYQDYYSDDEMKTRVTAKWPQDVKLGYTFNFTGVKMNITTYADGKPAAELMFGDVA